MPTQIEFIYFWPTLNECVIAQPCIYIVFIFSDLIVVRLVVQSFFFYGCN